MDLFEPFEPYDPPPLRNAKDASGMPLIECGLQFSKAAMLLFCCYDRFPGVGGKIHCIEMPRLIRMIRRARMTGDKKLVYGSLAGAATGDTGLGYLWTPKQLGAVSEPLPRAHGATVRDQAMMAARIWLRAHSYVYADVESVVERLDQINLWVRGVDGRRFGAAVKCRDHTKYFAELFIEVASRNPEGLGRDFETGV